MVACGALSAEVEVVTKGQKMKEKAWGSEKTLGWVVKVDRRKEAF